MNSQDIVLIVILTVVVLYLLGCIAHDRKQAKRKDKRIEQYKKDVGCYLL